MTPHLGSNLLILLALCGEATYSSAGRPLVERYSPLRAFGTASLLGAAFITISVFLIKGGAFVSELGQLSWKGVAGLLWLGPLGTTATYLYWMFALKEAPVASLALTIFVQPLFGALWGYWLLGDRLSVAQTLGGVLILLAVFAETARYLTRRATFPAELPPPAP